MRRLRHLGPALLACVGLAFVAFGIDDVSMDAPPPMQERYFERIGGVSEGVRAFALAAFDGRAGSSSLPASRSSSWPRSRSGAANAGPSPWPR